MIASRLLATALGGLLLATLAAPAGAQVNTVPIPTQPDVVVEQIVGSGGPGATGTQDPTAIAVAEDGRVIFAERLGRVKVWGQDGTLTLAGHLDVAVAESTGANDQHPEEGGIHGLELSPSFADDGLVYLYYTVPGTLGVAPTPPKHPDARRGDVDGLPTEGVMRLSRFVLGEDNRLDLAGEEVLFENPAIFDNRTFARDCCHQAGDLDWLPDGTLLLAIGDDTNPFESDNFTPIDERPGRDAFNAQLTSANPADRRGKVLRLDVQNLDGEPGLGDMIPNDPEGPIAPNPHVDDPRYDPAVYAMGFRNPYRIAVDEETGTVIVGNFNPDATAADPQRGPEGFTEVDTVPPGGGTDHGWPYCIADNRPYIDYDFATGVSGEAFECTGIDGEPYHEPDLYYSYGPSAQHPTLAVGTVGPMPGVVYDYDGDGAYRLPGRIHGQLVFLEWSRMAAYTIPVGDVDGDGESELGTAPTDVVPLAISLANPIDAAIGPDGAVYVAEFGRAYGNNPDSAISRIRCAACLPDPTDYGMAEDATLFVGHRTALTGGEATDAAADDARARLSLQAVAGAALVGLALLPLRRRRDVL